MQPVASNISKISMHLACTPAQVKVQEPNYKLVEVEQCGELRVLWIHRVFKTYLDVTEDARDPECLKTEFTLLRSVRGGGCLAGGGCSGVVGLQEQVAARVGPCRGTQWGCLGLQKQGAELVGLARTCSRVDWLPSSQWR